MNTQQLDSVSDLAVAAQLCQIGIRNDVESYPNSLAISPAVPNPAAQSQSAPVSPVAKKARSSFTSEQRQQIINMDRLLNYSLSKIEEVMQKPIGRPYLKYLRNTLSVRGTVDKLAAGGKREKSCKYTYDDKVMVCLLQDESPDSTIQELCAEFTALQNKPISRSSLYNILKEGDFTTKVLCTEPIQRNTQEAIDKRAAWAVEALHFEPQELIYVDEFGCTMHGYKNRNISVIAAMCPKRAIVYWSCHTGGTNTDKFVDFLKGLAKTDVCKTQANYILMDNASIHKSARIQEVFDGMRFVQTVKYVPAYSPQCNAIENCFSKWKQFIKRYKSSSESGLKDAIAQGAKSITVSDSTGYHTNVVKSLIECQSMQRLR